MKGPQTLSKSEFSLLLHSQEYLIIIMLSKQTQKTIKNAYWQVLINCPQDEPEYIESKRRITQVMSVYFIHEKRLKPEDFKQIIDYVHNICTKSYGRNFKDCSDDITDDILYLAFQKYLTLDYLQSFYTNVLDKKPQIWCEKCRRFSVNTSC